MLRGTACEDVGMRVSIERQPRPTTYSRRLSSESADASDMAAEVAGASSMSGGGTVLGMATAAQAAVGSVDSSAASVASAAADGGTAVLAAAPATASSGSLRTSPALAASAAASSAVDGYALVSAPSLHESISPNHEDAMCRRGEESFSSRVSSAASGSVPFSSFNEQRLLVTVELASRSQLLADLSTLLADLSLDVIEGSVTTLTNGVARDSFYVRYRGALELSELEARLQSRLRESLQVMPLRPGAYVVPDSDPDFLPTAAGPEEEAGKVLLGMLDLTKLGGAIMRAGGELGHMWARCLRCRAPDLLTRSIEASRTPADEGASSSNVAGYANGHGGSGGDDEDDDCSSEDDDEDDDDEEEALSDEEDEESREYTQRWLTELQKLLLLRLRVRAGGVQIEDGLSLRELQLGPTLGQGAFGVVRLARSRLLPDRFYAVKILRTDQPGVKDEMKAVEREREVLALLARECRGSHHRQLYTYLVASGEEVNTLCLVMPAALGGELFDLLRDHGEMAESAAQFYAACLVLALQHLHSLGVAYRDLKAENVLLTGGHCFPDAGWPVLTDMGLANFAKADLLHSFCGTPSFIAPEVATNVGYSTAIDWWGLGVLVCQMLNAAHAL